MLVYEIRLRDPVTLGQYMEQLRHYVQTNYREPRIDNVRPVTVRGRSGVIMDLTAKNETGQETQTLKGIFEISPKRLVAVDGVFPGSNGVDAYEELVTQMRFPAPKPRPELRKGLKAFDGVAKKLSGLPIEGEQSDDLDILSGNKKVGGHRVKVGSGSRFGLGGTEIESITEMDLGDQGRLVIKTSGFLSHDLSRQELELERIRYAKDGRTLNFEARLQLKNGEVRADRRINGERSESSFSVPPRTILGELAEALQGRIANLDRELITVPVLSAFENQLSYLRIEVAGLHRMRPKLDAPLQDVYVLYLLRDDGALLTYWYGPKGSLLRVTEAGKPLVYRARSES